MANLYGIKGSLDIDIGSTAHLHLITNDLGASPKTFMVHKDGNNPNSFAVGEFATWVTNKVGGDGGSLSSSYNADINIDEGLISSDGRLILDVNGKYTGDIGDISSLGDDTQIKIGVSVNRLPLTLTPDATTGAAAGADVVISLNENTTPIVFSAATTIVSFDNQVQTNKATAANMAKQFKFAIPAGTTPGNYNLSIQVESDGYTFSVVATYKVTA